MTIIAPFAGLALYVLFAAPALAQSVDAYDDAWHRGAGFGGEYPNGFTVLRDTTIKLRPKLSPTAEKTIDCPLPARATYHPWNTQRYNDDGLGFVTYTEKQEWEVTAPYEIAVHNEMDGAESTLAFRPGDRFTYLEYYAEGTFALEFDGQVLTGDQGLLEASKIIAPAESRFDQWMRINCSNNMWGWLYMPDLPADETTFTGPNIGEYGSATDLP